MNHLYHLSTICLVIYLLFCSKVEAQSLISEFEYKKGKHGEVYAMTNGDSDEPFLLAFKFRGHVNLFFLDSTLQLVRKISSDKFPPHIWRHTSTVEAIINTPEELCLFVSTQTPNGTSLFRINKENGSHKFELLIVDDMLSESAKLEQVKAVKTFIYQQRFYKIWANKKSSEIAIYHYDLDPEGTTGFETFKLSNPNLCKALTKRKVIPTPVISHYKDVSLLTNAKTEKIYAFDGELIFSVEDHELGMTHLAIVDTDKWELYDESYPVPGFISMPVDAPKIQQQFNSFIYDNGLYQVIYTPRGLTLSKVSFGDAELIAQQHWASEKDFLEHMPINKSITFQGADIIEKENPDTWKSFSKSIAVMISPEDKLDRLTIGSHIYMKQGARDALNTVGVLASLAGGVATATGSGFIFLGSDPVYSLFIDPYSSINYIIDLAFLFSTGKYYQVESAFDAHSLQLIDAPISKSEWDQSTADIHEFLGTRSLFGVSIFDWNEEVYVGYWKNKKYNIFSVP